MTTLAALAALGWSLAALAAGLWLGERGRRMDAQRREGVVPVGRPRRPQVSRSPGATATHDQAVVLEEARERYIEDTVREGFTREEAEQDWEQMMAQANVEKPPSWTPS